MAASDVCVQTIKTQNGGKSANTGKEKIEKVNTAKGVNTKHYIETHKSMDMDKCKRRHMNADAQERAHFGRDMHVHIKMVRHIHRQGQTNRTQSTSATDITKEHMIY